MPKLAAVIRRAVATAVLFAGALATPSVARAQATPMTAADTTALLLVERAALAYGSTRTLQAHFSQTLTNPRNGSVQFARGEFFQHGPTKFAFKFTEPAADRIIADGEMIWLYLPSSAPGQALKVPRAAGAGLDLASSILRTPRDRYRVRALPDTVAEGRAVRRLTLTPTAADAPFRTAELWIDPTDALIRRAVLAEPLGMVRTIDFTRVRVGEPLPADAFVFVAPEGVRIIDQAALLGGSVPPRRP
jgi:outer membrane lipoprotein carrier protein